MSICADWREGDVHGGGRAQEHHHVHSKENNYPAGTCSAGVPFSAFGGEANAFLNIGIDVESIFLKKKLFAAGFLPLFERLFGGISQTLAVPTKT